MTYINCALLPHLSVPRNPVGKMSWGNMFHIYFTFPSDNTAHAHSVTEERDISEFIYLLDDELIYPTPREEGSRRNVATIFLK